MALRSTIICSECKREKDVFYSGSMPIPTVCNTCIGNKELLKEEEHLAKLAALPMEERVAKIEKWVYNYRPPTSRSDILV